MNKSLMITHFFFAACLSHAQIPFLPNLDNADIFRERGVIAGYSYNFDFDSDEANHVVELGYKGAYYINFFLTSSINYYAASDFNLRLDNFFIGPKIGGYIGFNGLIAGSDLVFFTNFGGGSLRWVPYGGLGSHAFRLVFAPHVSIINNDFQEVNPYNITLSVRLVRLGRERIIRNNN